MDLIDEPSRISLGSQEQDHDQYLPGVELGQLNENVSDNRKLDVVLGALTTIYAVVQTVIHSQSNISYDYVRQMIQEHWRDEIATSIRWKAKTAPLVATTGHEFK